MENSRFQELLKQKTAYVNDVLEQYLPVEEGLQKTVLEAMNYSVSVGGKRLRPIFLWESFLLCGGRTEEKAYAEPFMAALEMIHTYSLVHDDLPAMDNDVLRRGKPTTWYQYGEATGILAGDGLLNYAFETVSKELARIAAGDCGGTVPGEERLKRAVLALEVLSRKAGVYGMIGGQTVDLEAEGKGASVSEEELLFIHKNKTAALIQAPMMIGAILAGAGESQVALLENCACHIGLAFQIQDDILDVVGDTGELGKTVGSDAQNDKQTYVRLKGLEQAEREVETLSLEAVRILDSFEGEHEFLKELVMQLIGRRK